METTVVSLNINDGIYEIQTDMYKGIVIFIAV
ncbi:hypothetical protein HNQ85_001342 [Anoxybacillus calidus]|jgi:hypothetical protein|uniref:Uncharacterized protein n=1 Tax=[Anoxybacillus] calidus TaxID=575178 RepID=A0A7V9YZ21_9BACL|nr:hypothetical protein [Anoxybacillus calidus]